MTIRLQVASPASAGTLRILTEKPGSHGGSFSDQDLQPDVEKADDHRSNQDCGLF
jgi:hypothetical protein